MSVYGFHNGVKSPHFSEEDYDTQKQPVFYTSQPLPKQKYKSEMCMNSFVRNLCFLEMSNLRKHTTLLI